jgi:hypothetical protein
MFNSKNRRGHSDMDIFHRIEEVLTKRLAKDGNKDKEMEKLEFAQVRECIKRMNNEQKPKKYWTYESWDWLNEVKS